MKKEAIIITGYSSQTLFKALPKGVVREEIRHNILDDKKEVKEIVKKLYKQDTGFAIVSDGTAEGIKTLYSLAGYLIACGVFCEIVAEGTETKKGDLGRNFMPENVMKWLYKGVNFKSQDEDGIPKNSLIHTLNLDNHMPEEFARLLRIGLRRG